MSLSRKLALVWILGALCVPAQARKDVRLRGAMVGNVTAADLDVLGRQWKANHVRWQLTWGSFPYGPGNSADLTAYEAWLETSLTQLDALLPACRKAGLAVLVDLHTPPGGRPEPALDCRVFKDREYQEAFVRDWEKIARRYKNNPAVWGYDLMNEPSEGSVAPGLLDWNALALRTARAIRAIDAKRTIVVEPAPWGGPSSLKNLKPLTGVDNVVYSVHMYEPGDFTQQAVFGKPGGIAYPGVVKGVFWDKARLKMALQPVMDFQKKNKVPIYIGEFSAIRWSPGESAYNYLRDCIDIFEANNWSWAYHAFREWDGWSVEHDGDEKNKMPTQAPTKRQILLWSFYAKNQKPPLK